MNIVGPLRSVLAGFNCSNIFVKKIGFNEMNVQKFRNFVITEFVKSGIHCIYAISGMLVF